MRHHNRTIAGTIGLSALLLVAGCGSDDQAVDDSATTTAGDSAQLQDDVELGEATFLVESDRLCTETRKEVDGLLAAATDPAENPQPVVQGIAAHFHELYDGVSNIEGFAAGDSEVAASYLDAVLAAADEADAAAASPEAAVEYLGSNSKALIAVNKEGTALGITACQIELEPTAS